MDIQTGGSEKVRQPLSGYIILVVMLALLFLILITANSNPTTPFVMIVLVAIFLILSKGLIVVEPNSAKLFLLFGAYQGSVRNSGFYWVNPFYKRTSLSLRPGISRAKK